MAKYKVGDVVLVKSVAGDCIPKIHVRLVKRVVVKPQKGHRVGLRRTMDWPGYSGWDAEIVYQDEADRLRKEWSIPFEGPGDKTFVYDNCIIKKPRKKREITETKGKRIIVRKNKKN
tara:strand:- start:376 stop:726 length:351 start_codon:yes stop_codon:yes gene_type:complete